MPLGASITQGLNGDVVESQQNGYRRLLREQLRYWGYPVNMIGSKSNGDFIDKQHEGHPGYQITAIASAMESTLSRQKPNLVLINAGTNDCVQADNRAYTPLPGGVEFVKGTYDRMKTMIDSTSNDQRTKTERNTLTDVDSHLQ
jgi:lysophospholipase L1-like esterase